MFCLSKTQGRGCWMQGQEREKGTRTQQNTTFFKLGSFGAWKPFPLPSSSVSTVARQVCPGSWCKPPQPFGRAWSCVGKQKLPVSKFSQTAPAGNGAPLECWPEGAAVLSQLHTAGISWGRLTHGKNKATNAHLPQVLS